MKSFSGKLLFDTCILPVLTIMCGSTDADVQRKIDEVSTFIAREMESYYVPGASVAILNNYKPEWTQGYGVTDMTSKEQVKQPNAVPGSLSEPNRERHGNNGNLYRVEN
jgi:CubicO group peptidase (beta-lactamase class C family)